MKEQKNSF